MSETISGRFPLDLDLVFTSLGSVGFKNNIKQKKMIHHKMLIKSDSKDIYIVIKDFYFKLMLFF